MNPYRNDFPIFKEKPNGKRLVYLDNAATTQKPKQVLEAIDNYYRTANANPLRGLYQLSIRATKAYEDARDCVASFVNAKKTEEIIFTRNATEALNIVAYSYGLHFIEAGDEIVLPISEHHSNLLPWQMIAKAKGAKLRFLHPNDAGRLEEEELEALIGKKTKIVALAAVSNVLGSVFPVEKVIKKAHSVGAVVVLDAAQSIGHYPLDVQKLDVDFAAFSGHKMLAPMGIGVLYGKEALLNQMPPFLFGGEMIEEVHAEDAVFAPLPEKFEAGTQNVGGAVGLTAAIQYLQQVGYEAIARQEQALLAHLLAGMAEIPHLTVYGDKEGARDRCGVVSFNIDDVHPHDAASILDADGIAVRAGHHCAQPLMEYMEVNATCRASLYFYNTIEDIDIFLAGLKKVRGWLGFGA